MAVQESSKARATLFDVCRITGLSIATVSRVVNESPRVNPETRARVRKTMAELGYIPNHAAQILAGGRTQMLGVIFPHFNTGFYTEILRGIDAVAADHGYHLMTAFSHGGRDDEEVVTRFLGDRRTDALILMNLKLSDSFVRRATRSSMPVILLDRPVSGTSLPTVTIDNASGVRQVLTHLYGQGMRNVAVLKGDMATYDSQERWAACQQIASEAGIPWQDDLIWTGDFTEASGRTVIQDWLGRGRPLPQAVFCFNDAMAIGIMDALRERHLRVPEDVAIVGFDDVESARHVGLTTVRIPMGPMGRAAAGHAFEAMQKQPSAPLLTVLPTELIIRRSTGGTTAETSAGDAADQATQP